MLEFKNEIAEDYLKELNESKSYMIIYWYSSVLTIVELDPSSPKTLTDILEMYSKKYGFDIQALKWTTTIMITQQEIENAAP